MTITITKRLAPFAIATLLFTACGSDGGGGIDTAAAEDRCDDLVDEREDIDDEFSSTPETWEDIQDEIDAIDGFAQDVTEVALEWEDLDDDDAEDIEDALEDFLDELDNTEDAFDELDGDDEIPNDFSDVSDEEQDYFEAVQDLGNASDELEALVSEVLEDIDGDCEDLADALAEDGSTAEPADDPDPEPVDVSDSSTEGVQNACIDLTARASDIEQFGTTGPPSFGDFAAFVIEFEDLITDLTNALSNWDNASASEAADLEFESDLVRADLAEVAVATQAVDQNVLVADATTPDEQAVVDLITALSSATYDAIAINMLGQVGGPCQGLADIIAG